MDVRVRQPDDLTAGRASTAGLIQSLLAMDELREPKRQALLADSGRPDDGEDLR